MIGEGAASATEHIPTNRSLSLPQNKGTEH